MSDYDTDEAAQAKKRRRPSRACDVCRKKKIKCGGRVANAKKCSNCIVHRQECTFVEQSQARASYVKAYVEGLETHAARLERIVKKLTGASTLSQDLLATLDTNPPPQLAHGIITSSHAALALASGIVRSFPVPQSTAASDEDSEDEMLRGIEDLRIQAHKDMRIPAHESPFVERSTALALIHQSLVVRGGPGISEQKDALLSRMRPRFWSSQPWQSIKDPRTALPTYIFPEPDLMAELIILFLDNFTPYLPLFHRPTFERLLSEGHIHTNREFAAVVLCVCAVGARLSKDPRVLIQGTEASAGWVWFKQVFEEGQRPMVGRVTLYELQKHVLLGIYLQGTQMSEFSWGVFGAGVRLALGARAHRKAKHGDGRSRAEQELWKKAFWCLVWLDRYTSMGLGRSCAVQEEEIDVEYPAACDDEYWFPTNGAEAFVQPAGKPSSMAYFILALELSQMSSFCMRSIYCLGKMRALIAMDGKKWRQHLVTELDSTMNRWVDSIPEHLRWDPHQANDIFFKQSFIINLHFHHLKILAHRPFITSSKVESSGSLPSQTICTNAARVTSHMVACHLQRYGQTDTVLPFCSLPIFCAGLVLLLNTWNARRLGSSDTKELPDVQMCMNAMQSCEERWMHAGRLLDVLRVLYHATSPAPQMESTSEAANTMDGFAFMQHPPQGSPLDTNPVDWTGNNLFSTWPEMSSTMDLSPTGDALFGSEAMFGLWPLGTKNTL
ncbi:hypothetical protein CYLTODRAFT_422928 [Cylindrobasidium torrendii FP15055 ss-10]|uniref:Zn(2)-C6 fungal-type domain-containing protein n=1 Tax=Cylindrobasidium torrendii FP15055 ss-10 TaxID=1314674 RepID=A0A0D7B9R7_9AGAR|nr:hypothetical protein CYLTODRAFT_422928 [Cylindrobasidium torrendii FP15055 ss-10]